MELLWKCPLCRGDLILDPTRLADAQGLNINGEQLIFDCFACLQSFSAQTLKEFANAENEGFART